MPLGVSLLMRGSALRFRRSLLLRRRRPVGCVFGWLVWLSLFSAFSALSLFVEGTSPFDAVCLPGNVSSFGAVCLPGNVSPFDVA